MKKLVLLTLMLLCLASAASASIYSFLDNVVKDKEYVVVLGDKAPGGDSLAASDIVVGIQNYRGGTPFLEAKLASEMVNKKKMILVGHPCNNPLISLSCDNWPYGKDSLFLKVDGSNLIVSGTTDIDVRSVAKIVAQYRVFPYLKDSDMLLISAKGVETPKTGPPPKSEAELALEKAKEQGLIAEEAIEDVLEEGSAEVKKGSSVKEGKEGLEEEEKEETVVHLEEKKGVAKTIISWFSGLISKIANLFR